MCDLSLHDCVLVYLFVVHGASSVHYSTVAYLSLFDLTFDECLRCYLIVDDLSRVYVLPMTFRDCVCCCYHLVLLMLLDV